MRKFLMVGVVGLCMFAVPAFAKNTKTVADGSDPMPLCRQGHPGCPPKLVDGVFEAVHPNYMIADGGPLPICPPRCIPNGGPNCGKCGAHVIDLNAETDVFSL
jgi:hypothetical protein